MADTSLSIVTFNVWGLRFVSRYRSERIQAIGDIFAGVGPSSRPASLDSQSTTTEASPLSSKAGCPWDIICLQECWVDADADYLKRRAKEGGLPHARFFHSGAIGSGLMILSRYPILTSRMLPYPLNGHPLHVIEGDFFAGKGVGSATIDLGPERGHAEILVTHLFAPGGESPAHRLAQVWELGNLARSAADKGRHVFLCGDLNSMPDSLVMQFLYGHGGLHDAWTTVHPSTPSHSTPPSASDAVTVNGVTCDSPLCSFTAGKHLSEIAARQRGKRLDYILYRPSDRIGQDLAPITCRVTLTDPVPGQAFSLSDHFAVEARFVFQARANATRQPPPAKLTADTYGQAYNALSNRLFHARLQSRFQLRVFLGCCVLAVPVLPIAASFQPLAYLNWIFVLAGTFVGWLGGTMLYVGFVGGRWEEGALRNVLEELEAWRLGLPPA